MFRSMGGRAAAAMAGVVVAGAAAFTLVPASPAVASGGVCSYGSSGGNVRTCVNDSASSMSTSARVVYSGRVLQSCLHRNGARIYCTAYRYVGPGAGIGGSWTPGGGVPSGTYCALTWKKNPNGTTTRIGYECEGITTIR